jgi:excisionase family DNA binding protein
MTDQLPETMLTTPEVGLRLGVTRQTVLALINDGALPAYRIGKNWRIDPRDLAAYIASVRSSGVRTPPCSPDDDLTGEAA